MRHREQRKGLTGEHTWSLPAPPSACGIVMPARWSWRGAGACVVVVSAIYHAAELDSKRSSAVRNRMQRVHRGSFWFFRLAVGRPAPPPRRRASSRLGARRRIAGHHLDGRQRGAESGRSWPARRHLPVPPVRGADARPERASRLTGRNSDPSAARAPSRPPTAPPGTLPRDRLPPDTHDGLFIINYVDVMECWSRARRGRGLSRAAVPTAPPFTGPFPRNGRTIILG
jgi:hypothetical protein